jgi:4-aminobutyrate aminotransferase-like enzyme
VVRLLPPLTFSEQDAATLVDMLAPLIRDFLAE